MKNDANGARTKNFFTPKEAADYLGVSMTTFYQYLKKSPARGGPPVRRFGRNFVRLPREQFLEWAGVETKD